MKTLFKTGSVSLLTLLFFMSVSIALMVMDSHVPAFYQARDRASFLAWPIEKAASFPVKLWRWIDNNVASQQAVLDDNAQLHAKQFLLEAQLKKLLALQEENKQLKQLLLSSKKIHGKVSVADILAINLDSHLHQIILDKGEKDQVFVNQPVVDAYGVFGEVIHVSPLVSKVLLVSDSRFAIPVKNARNGLRAIAVGRRDHMELINLMDTSQVKSGDLFVTSGLGMRFPDGYPVGVVQSVSPLNHDALLSISAHLDQSSQALLVWPDQLALKSDVEHELKLGVVS